MERAKALLTLAAALAFAAAPLVVQGFDGFDPAQFPVTQRDPPVQPAGWAFSIWGLIYAWLIAGSAFGLWRRAAAQDWAPMRWPLTVCLALGTAWLWVAQRSPGWACVMIWLMLACALAALARSGSRDRWLQQAPVALLAGWLTAAACVALGILAGGYGLASAQVAALMALTLALAIALVVEISLPETTLYAAAMLWALAGVIFANIAPPNLPVLILAGVGAVVISSLWWMRRAR